MSKMLACQNDKSPQREGSGSYAAIIEPASPKVNGLRKVIPAPDSWAVATFTCAVARYRVLEIFSQTAGGSFLICSPLPKTNSLPRRQSVTSYS